MESYIQAEKGKATAYVGPDATNLFRAICLKHALKGFEIGLVMARNLSKTEALKIATTYTGKPYKRGEFLKAAADMDIWIKEMRAALPVEVCNANDH